MKPSEARAFVKTLPPEHQERVLLALEDVWEDGFLTGAAKLPRKNPFARTKEAEPKKKR